MRVRTPGRPPLGVTDVVPSRPSVVGVAAVPGALDGSLVTPRRGEVAAPPPRGAETPAPRFLAHRIRHDGETDETTRFGGDQPP